MRRQCQFGLVLFVVGLFGLTSPFAAEMLLLQNSESPWIFISPPRIGIPIRLVVIRRHRREKQYPLEARRARMAAHYAYLRLTHASDMLSYPGPVQLPLYLKELNQEL